MVSASTEADAWSGLPDLPHTAQELSGGIVARRHHFSSLLNSGRGIRRHPGPGDLGRRIAASPWSLGLPHGYGETRTVGFGVLGGLSSPAPTSWGDRFGARRNPTPTPPTPPRAPTPPVDIAPARPRTAPRPPAPRGNAPRRVIRRASISEGPDEPAGAASQAPVDDSAPGITPARPAPRAASPAPASRPPSPAAEPGASAGAPTPVQRLAAPTTPVSRPRPPASDDAARSTARPAREDAAPGSGAADSTARPADEHSAPSATSSASTGHRDSVETPSAAPSDDAIPTSAPTESTSIRPATPRRRAEYGLPAQRLEDPAAAGDGGSASGNGGAGGRARTPWGTLRNILSNRASTPRIDDSAGASGTGSTTPASTTPRAASESPITADAQDVTPPSNAIEPSSPLPGSMNPGASSATLPDLNTGSSIPSAGTEASTPGSSDPGATATGSGAAVGSAAEPASAVQRLTASHALSGSGDAGAEATASAEPTSDIATLGEGDDAPSVGPSYAALRGLPGPGMLGRALRDGMRARQGASAPQTVSVGALSGLSVRGAPPSASAAVSAPTLSDSTVPSTRPSVSGQPTPSAAREALPSSTTPSAARVDQPRAGASPAAVRSAAQRTTAAPLQRIASTRPVAPPSTTGHNEQARTASAGATGLRANARRDLGTAAMVARVRSGVRIARIFSDGAPTGIRSVMAARAADAPAASMRGAAARVGRAPAGLLGRPDASFATRRAASAAVQRLAAPRSTATSLDARATVAGPTGSAERGRAVASSARPDADDATFAPVGTVLASRWSAYRVAGASAGSGASIDRAAARALPRGAEARPLTSPTVAVVDGFASMNNAASARRPGAAGAWGASPTLAGTQSGGPRPEASAAFRASSTSPSAIQRIAATSTATSTARVTSMTGEMQHPRAAVARLSEAGRTIGSIGTTSVRAQAIAARTRDRARMPLAFAEPRLGEIAAPLMPSRAAERAARDTAPERGSVAPPAASSTTSSGAPAQRLVSPSSLARAAREQDPSRPAAPAVDSTRPLAFAHPRIEAAGSEAAQPDRTARGERSHAPGALGTALRSAAAVMRDGDDAPRIAQFGATASAAVQRGNASRGVEVGRSTSSTGSPMLSAGTSPVTTGAVAGLTPVQRISASAAGSSGVLPSTPDAGRVGLASVRAVPAPATDVATAGMPRGIEETRRARGHAGVFVAGHAPLPRAVETARVVAASPLASLGAPSLPAGVAAAQQVRAVQRLVASSASSAVGVGRGEAARRPGLRSGGGRAASTTGRAPLSIAARPGQQSSTPPASVPAPPSPSTATRGTRATASGMPAAFTSRDDGTRAGAVQRLAAATPRAGARPSSAPAAGFMSSAGAGRDRQGPSPRGAVQRLARMAGGEAARGVHADSAALALPRVLTGGRSAVERAEAGEHRAEAVASAMTSSLPVAGRLRAMDPREARSSTPSATSASMVTAAAGRAAQRLTTAPKASTGSVRGPHPAVASRTASPVRALRAPSLATVQSSASGIDRPAPSRGALGILALSVAGRRQTALHGDRTPAAQRIALPRAGHALTRSTGAERLGATRRDAGVSSPIAGGRAFFDRSMARSGGSSTSLVASSRAVGPGGVVAGSTVQRIASRAGRGTRSVRGVHALPRAAQQLLAPRDAVTSAGPTTSMSRGASLTAAGAGGARAASSGVRSSMGGSTRAVATRGASTPVQRLALPRGQRALPSIAAPASEERVRQQGMRILDVPAASEAARMTAHTGDLPVGGATLTAEAALRAVAAAADFRRDRGEPASSGREARPSTPVIATPPMPVVPTAAPASASAPAAASTARDGGGSGPSTAQGAPHGAGARRAVQRLARGARAGLPRATGPAMTASIGALPGASGAGSQAGILGTRGGGRPDITSLPVGAAGAAGAVGAARRAAAEVVQTALSSVGMEADANGVMHPGASMHASLGGSVDGGSGTSGGGDSRHVSDGSYAAASAPVQRATNGASNSAEDSDRPAPSAAEMQDRVADLMDALEERILAQIERRGGRYRGMFS